MSAVCSAMCWMPSPWYSSRYSWICERSSEDSLIGMRILRQRLEIHVVDRVAVIVLGIAIDEVDERVADALDRRDAELARPGAALHAPGAALEEPIVRRRGILHAEGDGAHARAVAAGEVLRERARLGVDDEVGVALLVA